MTEKDKRTILDMRAAGKQYKEISVELGIEAALLFHMKEAASF